MMEAYKFRIVFIYYFRNLRNLPTMSVSVRVGLWPIIRVICEICGLKGFLVAALPGWGLPVKNNTFVGVKR
jgi:hypothetical protein